MKNGDVIISLANRINGQFDEADWGELGLLTDCSHIIEGHPRMLRALRHHDQDYRSSVIKVLRSMCDFDEESLDITVAYLDDCFPDKDGKFISAEPSDIKLTFAPTVFKVKDIDERENLVALMMPFAGFDDISRAIKLACENAGFECRRADDVWDNATIIQDIFDLILEAKIVVVDFSDKNSNVMYETGLAHALGKLVIPITQSFDDIPSDMNHHRALKYLNNGEGLKTLSAELKDKLDKERNRAPVKE